MKEKEKKKKRNVSESFRLVLVSISGELSLHSADQRLLIGGPRSRSGPRRRPIRTSTCNWYNIENYYMLTKRFYFNWRSFSSIYGSVLAGPATLTDRMRCKSFPATQPIKSAHSDKRGDSSVWEEHESENKMSSWQWVTMFFLHFLIC